jgi:hypothetical protein
MSVTKVQTETTYNVEIDGAEYSVIHCEDNNLGYTSWDVFDDSGFLLSDQEALPIIEYTIENMDTGGHLMPA